MENTSKLKIIRTVLNVGAEKPFKVLHVTDSHITRGDVYRGRRTKTFSVDFENCAEEYSGIISKSFRVPRRSSTKCIRL